jgi:hypothetical protein
MILFNLEISVVEGSATGMVVTIGDSTVMGRIAELAEGIKVSILSNLFCISQ